MNKKVLLMGKCGSGKSSMRKMIFADYMAQNTHNLGATVDVEHASVRLLGNLELNLWDCGGQDTFMENYLVSRKENIFRDVQVLIYVFDVEIRELEKDYGHYQRCLENLTTYSPNALVFCMIHKMDLIKENERDSFFVQRETDLLNRSKPVECICFKTSIWDETLFKAWSAIVCKLIPNVEQFKSKLSSFAEIIKADEVTLFERATFLVISHCERKVHSDINRLEKVSNMIKYFKLKCSKDDAQIKIMDFSNKHFALYMDLFTPNTYIMVVSSGAQKIPSALLKVNINSARKSFEKLEKESLPQL